MGLKESLEKKELKKGSLMSLVLKKGVRFEVVKDNNRGLPYNTTVYSMPEGNKPNGDYQVLGVGRIVEVSDDFIRLVQNYNISTGGNDESGYVGGTVYHFDAIEKWRVSPSIEDYYEFLGEEE